MRKRTVLVFLVSALLAYETTDVVRHNSEMNTIKHCSKNEFVRILVVPVNPSIEACSWPKSVLINGINVGVCKSESKFGVVEGPQRELALHIETNQ